MALDAPIGRMRRRGVARRGKIPWWTKQRPQSRDQSNKTDKIRTWENEKNKKIKKNEKNENKEKNGKIENEKIKKLENDEMENMEKWRIEENEKMKNKKVEKCKDLKLPIWKKLRTKKSTHPHHMTPHICVNVHTQTT